MPPTRVVLVAAIMVLVVPAAAVVGESSDRVSGKIVTPRSVSVAVVGEASLSEGVLHAHGPGTGFSSLSLTADAAVFNYTEYEGEYVRPTEGDPLVQHGPEISREYRNLTNVSGTMETVEEAPQILGLVYGEASASAQAVDPAESGTVEDRRIVRFEYTESSTAAGTTNHGFSYDIDGPWPAMVDLDTASITGNFTVFVNNLTLSGTSDQGDWEHWTGRNEDPHPGGASGEFESRVTLVHVTNGTLTVSAPGAVELIGPGVSTTVDGVVSAQQASGRLVVDGQDLVLEEEPVQLFGQGELVLSATPKGARVNGEPMAGGSALSVQPSGTFDVRGPTLDTHAQGTVASVLGADSLGWVLALAVGLLGLFALAWTGRTWMVELRDKIALEVRERRISSWRATGDRLCEAHRYGRAAVWYRRVVDRYPESAEAWHSLAEALEYDDRPSEASVAYQRVSDRLGGDAYELVRAAKCAVKADEGERAVGLLVEAGGMEPQMVQQALRDPGLAGLRGRPQLAAWVGDGADDSRSYA